MRGCFTGGWVSGSDDEADTYYMQGQHLDDDGSVSPLQVDEL